MKAHAEAFILAHAESLKKVDEIQTKKNNDTKLNEIRNLKQTHAK